MPTRTGEGQRGRSDLTLDRTAAQTLAWYLGHRATITIAALLLAAGVITASALAAATAPPTPSDRPATGTESPPTVTVTTVETPHVDPVPTAGSITLTCTTDTQLTFAGTGSGALTLTVDGAATRAATGSGEVTVTVTGPPGTYTARLTATQRLDRIAWNAASGDCIS